MDWFLWLVVATWAVAALVTVARVGRPRSATTPREATLVVVIDAALIVGMLITR